MTRAALVVLSVICLGSLAFAQVKANAAQTAEQEIARHETRIDALEARIDILEANALPPVLEIPDLTPFAERALLAQTNQRFPDLAFEMDCEQSRAPIEGLSAVTIRCIRIDRIPGAPMPEWAD